VVAEPQLQLGETAVGVSRGARIFERRAEGEALLEMRARPELVQAGMAQARRPELGVGRHDRVGVGRSEETAPDELHAGLNSALRFWAPNGRGSAADRSRSDLIQSEPSPAARIDLDPGYQSPAYSVT